MTTLLCLGTGAAFAQALPGGTLDPTTIPKYVTPLVIPPVMNDSGRTQGPNAEGLAEGQEYDIAVRQFKQQILPGGIWNTINGRNDSYAPTTIWSYGPAADPAPDSSGIPGGAEGVAPAPNSQFNYPAYTVENLKDTRTTVNWINDLVDENGNALPHLFPVDQSLHWANPAGDCKTGELRTDCMGLSDQPYTGPVPMVSHVHGAHVAAAGDGYTEAWWLPDANNITCVERDEDGVLTEQPTGYDENSNTWNVACEGTIANKLTNRGGTVVQNVNNPDFPQNTQDYNGSAFYGYHNDQPSATLWYHDHSLGMTRLNVYAGPAGFWLVRDAAGIGGETGLMAGTILPGPAPVAGEDLVTTNFPATLGGSREKYREIPIVIQGRSFNADGSLYYPDNRAFFEGLNVAGSDANGQGQFPPGSGELQIDTNPSTSDIAPIWNPEAFFNTMVVNGTTWPVQEVAPALYRTRLLNGTNSRFLNLALMVTDANGAPITVNKSFPQYEDDGRSKKPAVVPVSELRFWQIGAEQSLKPTVTAIRTGFASNGLQANIQGVARKGPFTAETPASDPMQALLLGPAERSDSIIDFRGLPNGTIITMTNTAPDAPFGGFPDVPADPATTGQVMRFIVNTALTGTSPTDHIYADGLGRNGSQGRRITYVDPFGKTRRMKNDSQAKSAVINGATAATDPWKIGVDPASLANFTVAVNAPAPRELALIEEESALICADADLQGNMVQLVDHTPVAGACEDPNGVVHPTALPFAPKAAVLGTMDAAGVATPTLWSDPITTIVGSNTAEQWNINNVTVDGHPIHVHLVGFKVLGRTTIGGGPSLNVTAPGGVQPWEDGWKDTVITYPGEVTSIAANFDINGLYVWHCHILEHEDNEMMVPMCVGEVGVDCPAELAL